MKRINEIIFHAVVLLICYSSGVRSESADPEGDKKASAWLNKMYNMGLYNDSMAGRSKSKPRMALPADWKNSRYLKPLKCSWTYEVGKTGYLRVPMDSPEPCYYAFLGSKTEKCTTAFYCNEKLTFKNDRCDGEFFMIGDGTIGMIDMTCGQEAGFGKIPRVARNYGTDIYVYFKGTSATECVVFCLEDSEKQFDPKKRLPKNKGFKGFPSAGSCECGKRMDIGRVVGGTDAKQFEFPWIGGLVWNAFTNYGRTVGCGVSLISDMHAITAAHCFPQGVGTNDYQILFHFHVANPPPDDGSRGSRVPGGNLPPSTDQEENSIRIDIEDIILHPLFDERTFDYDVAILVFKRKVDFKSNDISPICLPRVNEVASYSGMVVAGWGLVHETGSPTRTLQKLDIPFVDWNKCAQMTAPTNRHICAGYVEGGKDSCTGDSGGPLITLMPGAKKQYALAGIVSAGVGCARKNMVGIYTSVQEVIQWVYHQTASGNAKWCPR